MNMSKWLWAMGVVGLMGCADSTVAGFTGKQSDAVTAGADNTCDSYVRCNEVGSGKSFTTRDECITDRKAFWNERWPVADCDGKVNGDKLQYCLDAIKSTDCNSFIDQLRTVYGKCDKADVCSGKQ